jgi:lipoate-protein ligase A
MGEAELKRKKSLGEQIAMPLHPTLHKISNTLNVNQKKIRDDV